jgi:Carbohydrate family 9 binding domain-like/Bacterial Ig domain
MTHLSALSALVDRNLKGLGALLLFWAALCPSPAAAVNDIEPSKEFYTAIYAQKTIVLDGDLKEWSGVPVLADPKSAAPKGSGNVPNPNYVLFEEFNGGTWSGPDDQTSAVQIVYDADNVYFGFIVTDDSHENAANSAWNGDSIQLMIASADRTQQVALYNYALGGTDTAGYGDIIVNHEAGPADGSAECNCATEAVVKRDPIAMKTTYEIKLPKAALGLLTLKGGPKFGLGMAINDGDDLPGQQGQKGWSGLGAHAVVFGKTPSETAEITLAKSNDIEPTKEYYTALKTAVPIFIDGSLGEWTGAPVLEDAKFSIPKGSGSEEIPNYVLFEEYNGGTWTGPDDQTSAVQIVYDADNVYFGFVVTDDYHENASNSPWNGDSIQLMIANADRTEQVALYNYALGGIEGSIGDVIVSYDEGPAAIEECNCTTEAVITRDAVNHKTTYEIKLPKASLGLTNLNGRPSFGLGMMINDGDELTPGQRGWGGLGPHAIVFGKSPSETALITLAKTNEPPVLAAVPNQTVVEMTPLAVLLGATDPDLPKQTLRYSLVTGPTGLTVSWTGAVAWTSTEAQGPSTNAVTVRVSDGVANVQQTFEVIVTEKNEVPVLAVVPNPTVVELTPLAVQLSATDPDLPAQTLKYTLVTGPTGLTVSETGAVAWTPTEAQGPSTNAVTVRVSDGVANVQQTFEVIVTEKNEVPVLAVVPNPTVVELTLLAVRLSATDPDLPAQTLKYTLVIGPTGLTVSETGAVAWTPTEAQGPSTNAVTVRVSDGVANVEQTFEVIVTEKNEVPVLAVVPNPTVVELTPLALQLSATDPDLPAQTLKYTLVTGPTGLTVSETGAVTWTSTEAQGPSTNAVTVRVSDGVANVEQTFEVVVTEKNEVPVLAVVPNQTVVEVIPLAVQLSATDPDLPAQALTYTLVTGPTGLTVSETGAVTWTSTEAQGPSTNAVTVRVSDGVANVEQTFEVIVTEKNEVPVLAVVPNQTVGELTPLAVQLSATDPDLPAQTLKYTLVTGPTGLTVSETGAVVWTPTEAQGPSTNAVTVRVSDGLASADQTFQVIVTEVNVTPVLAAVLAQTVAELTPLALTLVGTDSDLPVQTLTYSVVTGPTGLTVSSAGAVAWTPSEAQGPSTNSVTVRVSDGLASADQTFQVIVTEVNVTPVLVAVPTQTIVELTLLAVTMAGTDSDLPAQTLIYSLVTGPEGLTVSAAGVIAWTPSEAQGPSTNSVTVRLSDGLASADQTFQMIVTEVNEAPVLAVIPPQSLNATNSLSLQLEATDPDLPGQTLTFNLESGPSGLTVSPAGLVAWNPPTPRPPSTNVVRVRLEDNGTPLQAITAEFVVTVAPGNTPPTVPPIPDESLVEGLPFTFTITAIDRDLPAQTLTFSLATNAPTGAVVDPQSGVFTWTPTEAQGPSTNDLTVLVTDSGNPSLVGSFLFHIVVTETNAAPDFTAVTNRAIAEGTLLTVTLSSTDSDLPSQTLTYSLIAGPAGLTVSPSGDVAWTPTEAQGPSTNAVTVRVSDGVVNVDQTFQVIATEINVVPVLAAVPDQTIATLTPLVLALSATDIDFPVQGLTYGLVNGPAGLTVSANGAVAWTPAEAQGPGTNTVTVRVSDGVASVTQTFDVTVTAGIQPPTLPLVPNQTIAEESLLDLTLVGADSNIPPKSLTYSLVAGPAGLTVSPTGALAWSPSEAQGPSSNSVTVRVSNGLANAEQSFQVIVTEVNVAPECACTDQDVPAGGSFNLDLTCTDADLPAQSLIYSLISGPVGITVSSTGVLAWIPTEAQVPSINSVTVRVSDGVEWTECTFQVRVAPPDDFTLRIGSFNTDTGRLELHWPAQPGQRFQVEYQAGLSSAAWVPLGDAITATLTLESVTVSTSEGSLRLFRVVRLP